MNKYKAIISDFDGTLVDENFYLSPKLKNTVVNLVKKDIKFCVATGRPYQGIVKEICETLSLSSPQIVNGGAQIIDPKTNKSIWLEYFPKDSARKLIKYFSDKDYDFAIEGKDFIFKTKRVASSTYGSNMILDEINSVNCDEILKMVLFNVVLIDDPQKVEEKLNNLFPDLHFVRSRKEESPFVLDITSERATKHLAVLELSKILNIEPSLIVGVGDGYNDYPLLSACGLKVAMENAPVELKEIADLIIPDVKHDGLVTLINSLYNRDTSCRALRYNTQET